MYLGPYTTTGNIIKISAITWVLFYDLERQQAGGEHTKFLNFNLKIRLSQ